MIRRRLARRPELDTPDGDGEGGRVARIRKLGRGVQAVRELRAVSDYHLWIQRYKFFRACLARFKLVPVEEDGRKRKKRRMEGEREKEKRQEEEKGGSRQGGEARKGTLLTGLMITSKTLQNRPKRSKPTASKTIKRLAH